MKKTLKLVALTALLSVGTHALASERMMIVLDGSGSMWGQIDGQPKLKIAQEALREMVLNASDSIEMGLMAYGHREKGECSDIEVLVAAGPNNKDAIIQAAESMRFLGKTPLSEAVRQAAQALRYTEEKATVVLITDGEETCQADPCALGTELSQHGIDFTAHVVGFDLTRQQGDQVACLAHNTGGQYFAAANVADLQEAMKSTLAAVQESAPEPAPQPVQQPVQPEPEPEPEEPAPASATLDGPEAAGSGTVIEVAWTGPGADRDYITVVEAGAKASDYNDYARIHSGNPVRIQVPDALGDYEIRYVEQESKKVLGAQPIVLIPVEASVKGPASALAGSTIEISWTGPRTPSDYITVVEAGAPDSEYNDYVRVGDKDTVALQMPDQLGDYEIRYVMNASKRVLASAPIVLEPVSATVEVQNAPVPGGKAVVAWTGPRNASDYVAIAARSAPTKELDYVRVGDNPVVTLKVPAEEGEYLINYVIDSSKRILASTPLTVAEAAGSVSAPVSVTAGSVISVDWSGPANRNDFIEIVSADSTPDSSPMAATRTSQGSPLSLHAPAIPGSYLIRYMMRDTKEILASSPIEIE